MLKKLKNNKANIPIIRVICYFLLVICIGFVLDVITLMAHNIVVSYEATYYAEKISIQGGLLGDERAYPSIREVKDSVGGSSCFNYKKPCTSCLINTDITGRISETFKYFGIQSGEWNGVLVFPDGTQTFFHNGANPTGGTAPRKVLDYMRTATFVIESQWQPIFMKFLWGEESYNINKHVTLVMEYIPQVDRNDATCSNIY